MTPPKGDKGPFLKTYDPVISKNYESTISSDSGASLGSYQPGTVAEVEQEMDTIEIGVVLEIWDPILMAILAGEL